MVSTKVKESAEVRTRAILSSVVMSVVFGVFFVGLSGCSGPDEALPYLDKISALEDENQELAEQIAAEKAEKAKLEKRIEVLSGLPADVKGEKLYVLERVTITKLTNLYDKDKDGKKEKLIVYLQPIDKDGDVFKAPGAVDVELWDLEGEAADAKIGDWQVGAEELRKLWFAAIMGTNYRLTFDVGGKVKDEAEPLTVRVAFTDLLTGKVFKEQFVIEAQPE
jgi:hypothetical protein